MAREGGRGLGWVGAVDGTRSQGYAISTNTPSELFPTPPLPPYEPPWSLLLGTPRPLPGTRITGAIVGVRVLILSLEPEWFGLSVGKAVGRVEGGAEGAGGAVGAGVGVLRARRRRARCHTPAPAVAAVCDCCSKGVGVKGKDHAHHWEKGKAAGLAEPESRPRVSVASRAALEYPSSPLSPLCSSWST